MYLNIEFSMRIITNKSRIFPFLPSNDCKWEKYWIEEKHPETTFHCICVAVKTHDPVITFEGTGKKEYEERH